MEFRQIPYLKILSLSFGLFTEESQLYSLLGQIFHSTNLRPGVRSSQSSVLSYRRLKRPPREAEPHIHRVSKSRVCGVIPPIPQMCLNRFAYERAWIVLC